MKYVEYPYSHRAIKKSQELHPQPQFPDFRVLVEIYRALWSEFSKGQLKQRRGTAVQSILSSQTKKREHRHKRAPAQQQSSENVTKSEPHCCSRAAAQRPEHLFQHQSLLRKTGVFSERLQSLWLCSAGTENITILLKFLQFSLSSTSQSGLNAQDGPPRVKPTVAGAVL